MDQSSNQQGTQPQPLPTAIQTPPIPEPALPPVPSAPSPEPISGQSKEAGPIMNPVPSETIKPTDQEPQLAPEVKEAGVQTVPDKDQVQLKPEVQAAGVEPVKTAVAPPSAPSAAMQLPMTDDAAEAAVKSHPAVDSIRWLATLIVEESKKLKLKMKNGGSA